MSTMEEKALELKERHLAKHDVIQRGFRTVQQLYGPGYQKACKGMVLSTGESVDLVLAYSLPEDDKKQEMLLKTLRQDVDARKVFFSPTNKAKYKPSTLVDEDEKEEFGKMHQRMFFEGNLSRAYLLDEIAEWKETLARETGLGENSLESVSLMKQIEAAERLYKSSALILESERGSDGFTIYVKIHAPFDTLLAMAEELNLFLPLLHPQNTDVVERKAQDGENPPTLMRWLGSMLMLTAAKPICYTYSAEFKVNLLSKFLYGDNPATYNKLFTPAQRSYLVYELLEKIPHSHLLEAETDTARCRKGIAKLIEAGVYTACFPLHDGTLNEEVQDEGERNWLYHNWAAFKCWTMPQPLDRIKAYFGEQIAFYFLWLGFYTQWLVVPSIVGVCVMIYGFSTYKDQPDAQDVCSHNRTICPICPSCKPFQLSCDTYETGWIFDNGATLFFSIFMSLWATLFLEFWKRKQAETAFVWDVRQLNETEPQRPEFRGVQTKDPATGALKEDLRPNPVTGVLQRFFPKRLRYRRIIGAMCVISLMITLVIFAVLAVIVFRMVASVALFQSSDPNVSSKSAAITSGVAALLNLVAMISLNMIYQKIAIVLTDWENHEMDSDYEFNLASKIFLFQFVNSYASIFYVAFFKGRFMGYPGNYNTFWGGRQEECAAYGCLIELTIQLAVIMVGKQVIGAFQETLLPKLQDWFKARAHRKQVAKENKEIEMQNLKDGVAPGTGAVELAPKQLDTPWEEQYIDIPSPSLGLFYEYLEMIIQFGFTTLFVAAFPFAPLCAFINNVFEMRVDALKMTRIYRRPIAYRAEDIGVWYDVLSFVVIVSVITNAFVIAVTGSFIEKMVYRYEGNGSLDGFVDTAYSMSPVTDASSNAFHCQYRGLRDPVTGSHTTFYYQVVMAQLAFVIVFEHFIFGVQFLIRAVVPDVPEPIAIAIQKEDWLAKEARTQSMLGL